MAQLSESLKPLEKFIINDSYHAQVPSFGEWGFNMAFANKSDKSRLEFIKTRFENALRDPSVYCRFLTKNNVNSAFYFDKDAEYLPLIPINSLENRDLVGLYEESFRKFH